MNTLPSIQKVFLDHLELLDKMYECGQNHYVIIQEKIHLFKTLKLPLIGTPLSHLFNAQIKQNYLIIQHIDNCQVYKDLLKDRVTMNADFYQQLNGLIEITLELKKESNSIKECYYQFLEEQLSLRNVHRPDCSETQVS